MARLPKSPTRHELDRLIIGNQIEIMAALELLDRAPRVVLGDRIQETVAWWRAHYNEDVTAMPSKED